MFSGAGDPTDVSRRLSWTTWLQQLDAVIHRAGLGFGVRDLQYIAEYVGEDDDRFNEFMWEAIAQKLLPKFRGTREKLEAPLNALVGDGAEPAVLPDDKLRRTVGNLLEKLKRDDYIAGT